MTATSLITPAAGSRRGRPPLPRQSMVYPESDGQPMADNTRQFDFFTVSKPPETSPPWGRWYD